MVPRLERPTLRGTESVGGKHLDLLVGGASPTQFVPIDSLQPADSPRLNGEDVEHIQMLAGVETKLPPILVHRQSMRVIDGMHRLRAAQLRNDEHIEVQFFDGSEQEAFVLGVKANVTHGRPLSLSDRTTAAERIMIMHPAWSDRAIATSAGLGVRSVANLRRRLRDEIDELGEVQARTGLDGRVRPLDSADSRLKAADFIKKHPDASLRVVARSVGLSAATVRDVRQRVERGESPVPSSRVRRQGGGQGEGHGGGPGRDGVPGDLIAIEALVHGLKADPSLRLTDSGRRLLRWVLTKVLVPEEWQEVSDGLPPHAAYVLSNVARRCATEWQRVADDLEQRTRNMA
ncbi:ParB/RepB/Spo0J family partition protein [Dactylosporangium sp. NPDC050588]|uniref:ParB/RepB/Spo0J family partition protein n=1 Tax=Dactylosporangium sp. NPDC050588 TaxID=3157211 RepID=UPI0033CD4254